MQDLRKKFLKPKNSKFGGDETTVEKQSLKHRTKSLDKVST